MSVTLTQRYGGSSGASVACFVLSAFQTVKGDNMQAHGLGIFYGQRPRPPIPGDCDPLSGLRLGFLDAFVSRMSREGFDPRAAISS